MKFKSLFGAFVAALLLITISSSTANADPKGNEEDNTQICLACAPSLGIINMQNNPNPNQCLSKIFTVNSGMSGRCTRLSYDWNTTDTGATLNWAGGNAIIQFSDKGIYTVCVSLTVGFDRDGDGSFSEDETCTVTECRTFEIDC